MIAACDAPLCILPSSSPPALASAGVGPGQRGVGNFCFWPKDVPQLSHRHQKDFEGVSNYLFYIVIFYISKIKPSVLWTDYRIMSSNFVVFLAQFTRLFRATLAVSRVEFSASIWC